MACGAAALLALLLALAALALPSAARAAYAPWAPQTSGTTQPLYGVWFADESAGWAVGSAGTILHTVDGGTAWKAQASKTTQSLNAVAFTGAAGWAVGNGGTILHTTNGGGTWTAQKSGTTQSLHGVACASATTGWAVGGRGTVLRTRDGGKTWTAQESGTKNTLSGVASANASTLWIVGSKGTVRGSANGGVTWTAQSAGTRTALNAIGCSDASTAWIAGNGGLIRKTTNGSTWASQASGTSQTLRAVSVSDSNSVRIAGSSGTVRVTVDGGTSWAAEATGTTQTLYGIAWRGTRGWLVGGGGTILAYRPDKSAPTTIAAGLQADDHSGWINAAATVTLSATDAGTAGVAATFYTIDGGAKTTYSGPFSVSGQGHHTVTYWSVDGAANAEAAKTGFVNIDTTPPTVGSDADAAWHATDVTVHLNAADSGGSGVAATQYRAAGTAGWTTAAGDSFVVATSSGQGAHVFDIRSVDAAGNASVTGACTVRVDATPAVTTPTNLAADKISGWTTTAVSVSLAADDGPGSGVAGIHYTVDGGPEQTYTTAFMVSGAGKQHPVTYWSVDKNGNVEAVRTGWVNISDPYAQSAGLAPDLDSQWRNGAVTVTITSHAISGTPTVVYKLDGQDQQEVASPATFEVSGAGHHTVVFSAKLGGTESLQQTGYVNIDTVAPVTTTQVSAPQGWINHGVTLVFLANDDASGIAATFSALDGGTAAAGASREILAPADHSWDGVHKVTYWSTDEAGNAGPAIPAVVRIDTRKPTTRAPYSAAVTRLRTVKLRFVVKDQAPCAGTASAKIVVKNARGRTVKTIKIAKVRAGATSAVKFRCKLAKGKYRFFVYATDAARNTQSRIASNRLTVR